VMRAIRRLGNAKTGPALEDGAPFVALGAVKWGEDWLEPGDLVPTDGVSPQGLANAIQAGHIGQAIVPNGYKLVKVKA
jgi:hypothetical protein